MSWRFFVKALVQSSCHPAFNGATITVLAEPMLPRIA
jgi:hypothetical protein